MESEDLDDDEVVDDDNVDTVEASLLRPGAMPGDPSPWSWRS